MVELIDRVSRYSALVEQLAVALVDGRLPVQGSVPVVRPALQLAGLYVRVELVVVRLEPAVRREQAQQRVALWLLAQ